MCAYTYMVVTAGKSGLRRAALIVVSLLFFLVTLQAQPENRKWHILVLDSYHEGFAWSVAQFEGIKGALTAELPENSLDISVFHLDDRRFHTKLALTEAYFAQLAGDQHLDLIFTTDNSAYSFMRENPWRLARRIPLVFAGVNDYISDGKEGELLMTGIAENFLSGRSDTLKAALALLPGTKRVVFTLDDTPTSLAIQKEFEAIGDQFPRLSFDFRTIDDIEGQLALVSRLGKGDIYVPIGTHLDASGTLLTYEEAMERLSAACPVPSFGFIENRISHGIVGGKILTGHDHGTSAGKLGLAILRGAPPGSLPPLMDNPGKLLFDHRQLARFSLPESALPKGAEILFKPADPLAEIWGYLLAYTVALVVLTVIVILLVVGRRRLRVATERLARSEATLESYFENSPEAIFVADDAGRYLRVNRGASLLTGYSPRDLLRLSVAELLAPASVDEGRAHFSRVFSEGKAYGELQFRRQDGSIFWMSVHAVRLGRDENFAICQDITRRIEGEEGVKRSLIEKVTLLRELYHRTKNNMSVIIAMLELQALEQGDERLITAFKEAENRIRSMALVHQKLYDAADLSHINLKDYIRDLIELLSKSYNVSSTEVAFDTELDEVEVLIDSAIPCGLILNELISNALIFAFPEGRKGRISVSLRRDKDGSIEFFVADDGIGVPIGFDFRRDGHLGLQTIFGLGEGQLEESVDFHSGAGLACRITFKDDQYRPRV